MALLQVGNFELQRWIVILAVLSIFWSVGSTRHVIGYKSSFSGDKLDKLFGIVMQIPEKENKLKNWTKKVDKNSLKTQKTDNLANFRKIDQIEN